MVKWAFQRLSGPQLGDQKVTSWITWQIVLSKAPPPPKFRGSALVRPRDHFMAFNPGCFSLPPHDTYTWRSFSGRLFLSLRWCFRIETRVQIWTPENILKQMKENTTNNAPRIPFHRRRHQSLQPRVRICSVWHGTKYSKRGSSIETIIYIYIVTSWNQTPTTIEYRNHHLKPKHYLSIDTSHTSRLFQLSGFPVSSGIFQKSESKTIGCNFKKCGGCISHSKQIKFLKTTRLKTPVLFHSASDRCFFFLWAMSLRS